MSSWHLRQIKRLNLEDGSYTDLCNIPGRCLNACGIHPQTNLLYCNERPGNDNLVRVDCDINVAELETSTSPSEMEDFCDLHKWEDHCRLTWTYIYIYIYKHTHIHKSIVQLFICIGCLLNIIFSICLFRMVFGEAQELWRGPWERMCQ